MQTMMEVHLVKRPDDAKRFQTSPSIIAPCLFQTLLKCNVHYILEL